MDFNSVDEWTDGDRLASLELIRRSYANLHEKSNKSLKVMAELLAKAQVELEIMWEAQRECARRHLDATGRGNYGNETLEHELDFFKRLGESQVILRHKPRPSV